MTLRVDYTARLNNDGLYTIVYMKVQKKKYGASQRVKRETIALINRLEPSDMAFDAKLYKLLRKLKEYEESLE